MKYAKRRDANEPIVIAALEAVGAAVVQLDGDGLPDLLVAYRGALHLVEVKNPASKNGQHYATDGLTKAQVKWFAEWRDKGGNAPHVVKNADEALRAIGARSDS